MKLFVMVNFLGYFFAANRSTGKRKREHGNFDQYAWARINELSENLKPYSYDTSSRTKSHAKTLFFQHIIPIIDKLTGNDPSVKWEWFKEHLQKNGQLNKSPEDDVVASLVEFICYLDTLQGDDSTFTKPLTTAQITDLKITLASKVEKHMTFDQMKKSKSTWVIKEHTWRAASMFNLNSNGAIFYTGERRGPGSYFLSDDNYVKAWEKHSEPWSRHFYKHPSGEGQIQVRRLSDTCFNVAKIISKELRIQSTYCSLVLSKRPYWVLPWRSHNARCTTCLDRRNFITAVNTKFNWNFRIDIDRDHPNVFLTQRQVQNRLPANQVAEFVEKQEVIKTFDEHYLQNGQSMEFAGRMLHLMDKFGRRMFNTVYFVLDYSIDIALPLAPDTTTNSNSRHVQVLGFHFVRWTRNAQGTPVLQSYYGSIIGKETTKNAWVTWNYLQSLFDQPYFQNAVGGIENLYIAFDHGTHFVSKFLYERFFNGVVQDYAIFQNLKQLNIVPLMTSHGESNVDHLFGRHTEIIKNAMSQGKLIYTPGQLKNLFQSAGNTRSSTDSNAHKQIHYHYHLYRGKVPQPPVQVSGLKWSGIQSTLKLRANYRNARLTSVYNYISPWCPHTQRTGLKIWPPVYEDDMAFLTDSGHVFSPSQSQTYPKPKLPQRQSEMGKVYKQYLQRNTWRDEAQL